MYRAPTAVECLRATLLAKNGEGPPPQRWLGKGPSCRILCICKPGPVPRSRGASIIYLGSHLRTTSIDLPSGIGRAALSTADPRRPTEHPVYMVFQPVGFTKLPRSHGTLVGSYPTFSSLPPPRGGSAVSLSAALSMTWPFPASPLPVRKHGALRCPDFPPHPLRDAAMERCTGNQRTRPPTDDGG